MTVSTTMTPEIRLSRSVGGYSNSSLAPWSLTFDELVANLSKPTVGTKDGSYFVRGPFNGTALRADQHITEANVAIIDGDSRMDPETGTIESGAPHPLLVHEALRDEDITHCIYTSHSHGGEKGNRWRLVIPAPLGSDHRALMACVDYVLGILHRAGVFVAPARENYAWSQPWYLPRIRDTGAEFLTFAHDGGETLDVASIMAAWHKEAPRQPDVAPETQRPKSAEGLIGHYVAEHGTPEKMAKRLEAAGYLLKSAHHLNDAPCYRYLHPRSQTGQPGVLLYRARNGVWRVCSHHGDYCQLAEIDKKTGKPLAHDAFDLFRIFEHGGDLAKGLRAIDPRPTIKVFGGSLETNVRQAIRALGEQQPPTVFQRGTLLTRVAHLPEAAELLGMTIPKGTSHLLTLTANDMRLRLAKAAMWSRSIKENGEVLWVDADPPVAVAHGVLSSLGEWGKIPPLIGLTDAPIIRPDGSIMDRPGFDPASRLYYGGSAPPLTVPDRPSREDAIAAARYALSVFAEFPFLNRELDEAVTLALLLTLIKRPGLQLAPLFGISATAPGSGKGLWAETCNLLVRGRDAALMPPVGGTDGDQEMRKRITALLMEGIASVTLDNWSTSIGGDAINALLTAATWSDRLLATNTTVTLPARVTWVASGNNLSCRGDMVRRTLLAIIDPRCERPEQREFEVKNLTHHVLSHRGKLLSALYTVLRAYALAGEPEKHGPTLGRFEQWTMAVAAPIRWLGWPDPIQSQERLRADDPETARLSAFLSAWHGVFGDRTITVAELIGTAMGEGHSFGAVSERRAALREALEDAAGDRPGQINRKKLGWFLRYFAGRVCDGMALFADHGRRDVVRYRVGLAAGYGL